MVYDVAVLGAGPAGLSAAQLLHQCGHSVCVVSDPQQNSQLALWQALPQFPGQSGTSGQSILARLQSEAAGCEFVQGTVKQLSNNDKLVVQLTQGQNIEARAFLLALGAHRKNHPLEGENKWLGKGVFPSTRVYGSFAKGKRIVVLGKSSWAAESALSLAKIATYVHFVIPASKLDISEALQHQLAAQKNIELITTASVKQIHGDEKVEKITIVSMGNERELSCHALFPCLAEHTPHPCLQGFVKQSEQGAVLVNEQFQTSQTGVFACGDILCNSSQFPFIAAAQGTLCASQVQQFLA